MQTESTFRPKGAILNEVFETKGIEELTESISLELLNNPIKALAKIRRAMEISAKERVEADKHL